MECSNRETLFIWTRTCQGCGRGPARWMLLTAGLSGIDGVVSTVAAAAIESQTNLIDAAIAAGVNWFVPSEYGSCTAIAKVETISVCASMFKMKQYLQEEAKAGQLTWTVLACGAFLEFLFDGPNVAGFRES